VIFNKGKNYEKNITNLSNELNDIKNGEEIVKNKQKCEIEKLTKERENCFKKFDDDIKILKSKVNNKDIEIDNLSSELVKYKNNEKILS
jgi:SMC interacting uncharacterized protein involved in chromosome segregation